MTGRTNRTLPRDYTTRGYSKQQHDDALRFVNENLHDRSIFYLIPLYVGTHVVRSAIAFRNFFRNKIR